MPSSPDSDRGGLVARELLGRLVNDLASLKRVLAGPELIVDEKCIDYAQRLEELAHDLHGTCVIRFFEHITDNNPTPEPYRFAAGR